MGQREIARSRTIGSGSFGVVVRPPIIPPHISMESLDERMPALKTRGLTEFVGKIVFDPQDVAPAKQAQRMRRIIDPQQTATIRLQGSIPVRLRRQIAPMIDQIGRKTIQGHTGSALFGGQVETQQLFYPYKNGTDLASYLHRPPPRQRLVSVCRLLIPILQVLKAMELQGWGHLDIKSENILTQTHENGKLERLYLNDWDFLADAVRFDTLRKQTHRRHRLILDYLPPEYFSVDLRHAYRSTALVNRVCVLLQLGLTPSDARNVIRQEFGLSSFYAQAHPVTPTMIDARALSLMDIYSLGLVFLDIVNCQSFAGLRAMHSPETDPLLSDEDLNLLMGVLEIPFAHKQKDQDARRRLRRAYSLGMVSRSIRNPSKHSTLGARTFLSLTQDMLRMKPSDRPSLSKIIDRIQMMLKKK